LHVKPEVICDWYQTYLNRLDDYQAADFDSPKEYQQWIKDQEKISFAEYLSEDLEDAISAQGIELITRATLPVSAKGKDR
jgi:hypothetical protein